MLDDASRVGQRGGCRAAAVVVILRGVGKREYQCERHMGCCIAAFLPTTLLAQSRTFGSDLAISGIGHQPTVAADRDRRTIERTILIAECSSYFTSTRAMFIALLHLMAVVAVYERLIGGGDPE